MIFLSLVLVIVAAVTLVLGVFQDGLVLIYVSIATCVAAMAVLGAGVLLRRREEASTGPASYGDAGAARDSGAIARTPVAPVGERGDQEAEADEDAAAARKTAVVRKVEATPTSGDEADDTAFRRPAAAGEPAGADDSVIPAPEKVAGTGTAAAAAGVTAAAATRRGEDDDESVRPVAKRAVVKRTSASRPAEAAPEGEAAPEVAAPTEETAAADATAKKATAKKATAKKATAKKATAKKATAKKATAKKATAKKATAKKATAKKATAKKATAKKATAKKATAGGRSVEDLASVRGLGPAKRQKLIEEFGSIDAVASATVQELSAVPGIGVGTARAIKDALG